MTKILFVIGTLDVGGTERQLVELLTRIDRRRFQPVVCCLSRGGALEGPLRAAGIPIHVTGFRGILPRGGGRTLLTLPSLAAELGRFLRVFRRERPDIVHGFLFWAYVLGAYAARLSRVPVVLASRRSLSHFKAGRRRLMLMERLANSFTDLVIANSEAVRRDAVRSEGLAPDKVIVIHNGVDVTGEAPTSPGVRAGLGLREDVPVVLAVANLIPYKGHRYLIEAWEKVRASAPGAVCLFAGEGPARPDLERRAAALQLDGSLRFLGTRHDVAELIGSADLLVHPSLEEGFCNAILEAMAAGKPVVATRVGGNPEAVADGVTGILVPPADSRALEEAVLSLLGDPQRRARLGEAGRRRAVECFSIESMVRRYEDLYDETLSVFGPRRRRRAHDAQRTVTGSDDRHAS